MASSRTLLSQGNIPTRHRLLCRLYIKNKRALFFVCFFFLELQINEYLYNYAVIIIMFYVPFAFFFLQINLKIDTKTILCVKFKFFFFNLVNGVYKIMSIFCASRHSFVVSIFYTKKHLFFLTLKDQN